MWDVVGGEQERLYEVAAAIGVPSYWLSAYVRGDADPPDGAVVGRLYRLALGQDVDGDGRVEVAAQRQAERMYQRMREAMEVEGE